MREEEQAADTVELHSLRVMPKHGTSTHKICSMLCLFVGGPLICVRNRGCALTHALSI